MNLLRLRWPLTEKKAFLLLVVCCFLAAAFIRINNNFRFAPACGYDANGHLSYIYQIKAGWGIPLANEGWSTFHPPLYYLAMAGVWKLLGPRVPWPMHIIFRLVSTLLNLGMAALVLLTMALLWPGDFSLFFLGLCFVLFVPLHIYTSSMIGNEQMVAFLTSLGLWLLILYDKKPRLHLPLAALLGIVCGLALLSKYTGVFLLGTITICLLSKILSKIAAGDLIAANDTKAGQQRKEHALALAIVLMGCFLLAGGFYARNIALFGHPFALSQDYPYVAEVMNRQPPGIRRWTDFVGFDLHIFQDPIIRKVRQDMPYTRSRYVWTLVYSNFWFESFSHFFLLNCDPWRQRIGKILLWLGLLPTFLLGVEIGRESISALRQKLAPATSPLLVFFFLNLLSFIFFNLKTPCFSAGKASYFLVSTLPLAIFMGRGTQRWLQRGRICRAAGILFLISLFGLSFAAFFLTHT